MKDRINSSIAYCHGISIKKPPGRIFDVNIYPRDYSAIKESFNPDFVIAPIIDHDIDHPGAGGGMAQMSQIDQDVATLLSIRSRRCGW